MTGVRRFDHWLSALLLLLCAALVAVPVGVSAATDGDWARLDIEGREGAVTVYDPVRERLIVFGGCGYGGWRNDVWALPLTGAPIWTQLAPAGTPPVGREAAAAAYDPVRDRVLVFGGYSSSAGVMNDVWALSLSGIPEWSEVAADGTPPVPRAYHSAVYDPDHDRVVVFGGWIGSAELNDVWSLSLEEPATWTALAPEGTPPSGRMGHSAICDVARKRMVVFGGAAATRSNETWALTLTEPPTWTALAPTGTLPAARLEHGAVLDTTRDRMIVFGGLDATARRNDAWSLALAGTPAWTQLAPTGTLPEVRQLAGVVLDSPGDRIVVFGGYDNSAYLHDTWAMSLASTPEWSLLVGGPKPWRRENQTTIHDPVRQRMVIFGGNSAPGGDLLPVFGDVWAFALTGTPDWSQVAPTGTPPAARTWQSGVYDPVRDRMLIIGGMGGYDTGYTIYEEVWALSLAGTPAWTLLAPSGYAPYYAMQGVAIYDPVRDRVLVPCSDYPSMVVHALTLAGTPTWSGLEAEGTPPGWRDHPSVIYDPVRDRVILFGGHDTGYLKDVWALSLGGAPTWAELSVSGTTPEARESHSAIYDPDRDRMIVFGGIGAAGPLSDLWELSLSGTPTWRALAPGGFVPGARKDHGAILDPAGDRMIVFGGIGAMQFNDVWSLTFPELMAVDRAEPRAHTDALHGPSPNPSRGRATVEFTLARPGRVRLVVVDVAGRVVRRLVDGERPAGTASVVWDGRDDSGASCRTGLYFVRLDGPGTTGSRRLTLLR